MFTINQYVLLAVVGFVLSAPAMATEAAGDPITSVPGRMVCQSRPVTIGDKSVDAKLCVTGGNFGHDKYAVKIGWSTVVEGIDDETTTGISGAYKGVPVALTCVPQHKAPAEGDSMVESMAKSLAGRPGTSSEEAHDMAVKMLTTEVGRLCTFRQGEQDLMVVQVNF